MTDLLAPKLPTSLLPANEPERLAALYRYDILDTSAEVTFDRVTSLAARLFQMPTVLISLVDESRAWFKSSIGFDASEVPRDATLCSFAVLTDEPLIVPDTQLDERFACNPFVLCEPGLRFYAGAPLLSRDGFNVGTLCLLDTVPHDPLTAEQQATLVDLAAIVIDELELRLVARQIARVDAALVEITHGISTVTGGAFMDALVQHLSKVLDTDYAYIGLIEGDDPKMMRTIATCAGGRIVDNLEYPLKDTPCWEVIEQRRICCYPRNVQSYFPNAPLLKPLVVESYVATPFFDTRGEVLGVLGVMDGKPLQDVHLAESLLRVFSDRIATEIERQQAEASLQKLSVKLEQQLYQFDAVASSVPDFIYTFDLSGRFTYVNQPLLDLWQQPLDRAVGKNFHELDYPPELAERLQAQIQQVIATHQPLKDESPYTSFHGTRAYEYVFVPLFSKDGAVEGVAGISRDITDRKEAEIVLQASEQRYKALIDVTTQIVWNADANGTILNSNSGTFTGQSLEELQGWGWMAVIHPDDRTRTSEVWLLAVANLTPYKIEHRLRRWDGEYRLMSARAVPLLNNDGSVREWVGLHTDVTEVRQDEQNLRRSEEFNRRILENNQDCIKVLDLDGRLLYMNDNAHKLLEIDDFAQYDRSLWMQFWGGSERELAEAALETAKAGTISKFEGQCPTVTGVPKWWQVSVVPLHDANGNVEQILSISHDLTERMRSEVAIKESEEKFRSTFEQAAVGIAHVALDGRWLLFNPKLCEICGYTPAELLVRNFQDITHPDDLTQDRESIRQILADEIQFIKLEKRYIHKLGHIVWINLTSSLRRDPSGAPLYFITSIEDISHRKHAEFTLQAQGVKLAETTALVELRNEELTRFSHTVSHDLKAPLRGISNLATWISEDLSETVDPDILANLELMRSRVSRMDSLIDGLLDYAKVGNTEASLETFSVNQLLSEIVDSLSIPDSFVVELPAELPPIKTNRVLLSQVLANLIGNAYKHHDSPGETLRERPDGRIQVTVQPDAKMWEFRVTDDGRGIAPENQERVFDIFKTMSVANKNNTGIGLSIVKKLVETQGGKITLESQLGMGSTFSFTWMAEIED